MLARSPRLPSVVCLPASSPSLIPSDPLPLLLSLIQLAQSNLAGPIEPFSALNMASLEPRRYLFSSCPSLHGGCAAKEMTPRPFEVSPASAITKLVKARND